MHTCVGGVISPHPGSGNISAHDLMTTFNFFWLSDHGSAATLEVTKTVLDAKSSGRNVWGMPHIPWSADAEMETDVYAMFDKVQESWAQYSREGHFDYALWNFDCIKAQLCFFLTLWIIYLECMLSTSRCLNKMSLSTWNRDACLLESAFYKGKPSVLSKSCIWTSSNTAYMSGGRWYLVSVTDI